MARTLFGTELTISVIADQDRPAVPAGRPVPPSGTWSPLPGGLGQCDHGLLEVHVVALVVGDETDPAGGDRPGEDAVLGEMTQKTVRIGMAEDHDVGLHRRWLEAG